MISIDPYDNGFCMQLRRGENYPVYGKNVAGEMRQSPRYCLFFLAGAVEMYLSEGFLGRQAASAVNDMTNIHGKCLFYLINLREGLGCFFSISHPHTMLPSSTERADWN